MWIFTRYSFYSIACASATDGALDPNTMMIRARRLDHLQKLQARFPEIAGLEIVSLAHRDYRYRLVVPKKSGSGLLPSSPANSNGRISRMRSLATSRRKARTILTRYIKYGA
jgi:hypothetical protein